MATLRRHYEQISKKTPTTKDVPAYDALQTVRRRTNWGEDLLPDKRQRFLDLDPDVFTKKKVQQKVVTAKAVVKLECNRDPKAKD